MALLRFASLLATVALLPLLTACGSSSTAIRPTGPAGTFDKANARYSAGTISAGTTEIPTHILNAVAGHLDAELRKLGLAATDGEGIRLDATTTYYRMRSGFSRMMVGVFAGKDGIECDVRLVDGATGQPVGDFKVKAYNLTAVGGEDDVARMLASEIAKALDNFRR